MAFKSAIGSLEVVITPSNAHQFVRNPRINGEQMSRGLIPRDFKAEPYGSLGFAKPFEDSTITLIPQEEWAERVEEKEKTKTRLLDLRNRKGIKSLNQNGTSYCWINAPTQAYHYMRAKQNQKHILFSPASCGAPIKGFRNVGGWGTQGVRYMAEHGCCPQEFWPPNAIERKYYTEENKKIAKKYRPTEWVELRPNSFAHLATMLLLGFPVAVGYNWWSHEVLAIDLVVMGAGRFGVRIDNSWGSGWSDNGTGILTQSKGTPNDAIALLSMTAA